MAVAREKGDQTKEQGGEDCDPALAIKLNIHRSQPEPWNQNSTPIPSGHPWNHGAAPLGADGTPGLVDARCRFGLAGGRRWFVCVVDDDGRRIAFMAALT